VQMDDAVDEFDIFDDQFSVRSLFTEYFNMSRRGRNRMVVGFTTKMFKMFLVITYSIMKRNSEHKSVVEFFTLLEFRGLLT